MADASQAQNLLPVIVGGAIAILGGLIGPPFVFFFSKELKKQKRRAEKLQEFAGAIFEVFKNIERQRLTRDETDGAPLEKVWALAIIHFPEMKSEIQTFVAATAELERELKTFRQETDN